MATGRRHRDYFRQPQANNVLANRQPESTAVQLMPEVHRPERQPRSLHELEMDAHRMYLSMRMERWTVAEAVQSLMTQYPEAGDGILRTLVDRWRREKTTLLGRADLTWAREELVHHLQCSQLRTSYVATVLGELMDKEVKVGQTILESVSAWRNEEIYQGRVIQAIASLKDEADERKQTADIGEEAPHWLAIMKETHDKLQADSVRIERVESMKRVVYNVSNNDLQL